MMKIKKIFDDQRIRFLFVGGINTMVGYGVYALLLLFGMNAYAATTFATIVGVINSYFWNKYFTFKSSAKSLAEIIRFLMVYGISFSLNLVLVYIFVDRIGMNAYVSGGICLFFTTLISYFGHKAFSFRQ